MTVFLQEWRSAEGINHLSDSPTGNSQDFCGSFLLFLSNPSVPISHVRYLSGGKAIKLLASSYKKLSFEEPQRSLTELMFDLLLRP